MMEPHNLHSSPDAIYVIKFGKKGTADVPYMGQKRSAYKILVRNPERKGQLVKPKRRWEDNIQTDLLEREWERGLD